MSGSSVNFDKRFYESQIFTSNGTFNVPDGVNLVFVEMFGGGGGGGTIPGSSGAAYGGEAGQFIVKPVIVTPGGSVSVTIGTGGSGAGPSPSPESGTDGTTTSFGAVDAPGGLGGHGAIVYGFVDKGIGKGKDSAYSSGGNNDTFSGGGNAGFGAGGNAGDNITPATDGGVGAGGGGSFGSNAVVGGDGGQGRCTVYWLDKQ